jgi:cobalt-zinc-cadmium efflux system membrane fusion protein
VRLPVWIVFFCLLSAPGCSLHQTEKKQDPHPEISADLTSVSIRSDSPKLKLIGVEAAKLLEMPVNEVVSPGKVELNPNRVSKVLLPVAGRIGPVLVKLGDLVESGQPLLSVEGPDVDAAVSSYLQAEGSITQSESALVKAQADYDRAVDLFDHNAIAKKEVLSAESVLAQAKVALEQANTIKEQALRRLELLGLKPGVFGQQVEVRAPLSGKILEINVAPGEYRNDTNASLMTIADLSSLWVSSSVPESYIRFIRVGEQVQIRLLAYPEELLVAKVRRIADTVDPQTRTIKVQSELDNSSGRFRPEMYCEVKHSALTRKEVVIPASAVIADKSSMVYIQAAPGHFRRIPVTLGRRSGNIVSILAGLKPGDLVVVDGEMLLK